MKAVISVFIDLKKAFDTIDHTIVLQKLCHYGICGIVSQWVCSYLTHRKQYVQIKGTKSSMEIILCGVRKVQFSALHCLIYILMAFVMYQAFWNFIYFIIIIIITLFADDKDIICSHNSTTSLCNTLSTEL